jgi:hypothetical protein
MDLSTAETLKRPQYPKQQDSGKHANFHGYIRQLRESLVYKLGSRNPRQQHLPINLDRDRQLPHEVDRIHIGPLI